jgi:hypothetical protein
VSPVKSIDFTLMLGFVVNMNYSSINSSVISKSTTISAYADVRVVLELMSGTL